MIFSTEGMCGDRGVYSELFVFKAMWTVNDNWHIVKSDIYKICM